MRHNLTNAELNIIKEFLPTFIFKPSPKQKQFFKSKSKRRLIRAGNQTGKSDAGSLEAIWRATGLHPYQEVKTPNIGLVVSADWNGYKDVTSKKIWDKVPKSLLVPGQDWDESRGFKNRHLKFKNGSVILFRSAESASTGIAGLTVDWVWIDEPPRKEVFGECLTRASVKNGPVWMTFTPIGRELTWLKNLISEQDWDETVIVLNIEDCPHRNEIDLKNQINIYGLWEYAQRVEGAWEGIEVDRIFMAFDEDSLGDYPDGEYLLGIGMDHGERAGKECVILCLYNTKEKIIYLIDEYVSNKITTPEDDFIGIQEMLSRHDFRSEDIDLIYGDINSAGKQSPGLKVNDLFERLFHHKINRPYKRPGSVEYGDRIMNYALKKGQLKISDKCTHLIKSMKNWTGDNDDLKDIIDAAKYICVPILESFQTNIERDRLRVF